MNEKKNANLYAQAVSNKQIFVENYIVIIFKQK